MNGGPLSGLRVVITRSKAQASELAGELVALGAEPIQVAMIAIVDPDDAGADLARAIGEIEQYSQVVVSSPNGARAFVAALDALDARPPRLAPVACVGPSTASVLTRAGVHVNVVPDRSVAEGLLEAMPEPSGGARLLLVQAAVARPVLQHGLAAAGWRVDRVVGYQTIDTTPTADDVRRIGDADAVIFTSSSTVERFARLVGIDRVPPVVISIGPITSATARDLGLHVDIQADPHTLQGVVDALITRFRSD